MLHHFIPFDWQILRRLMITSVAEDIDPLELLHIAKQSIYNLTNCWPKHKVVQPLQKTIWYHLVKSNIHDP